MNKIETLFNIDGSFKFDTRKVLNRSNKVIDKTILDEIEQQGVTCEHLETLGVPVFYYQSQITLHGLFPELSYIQPTGYKSIFQNQNKSIGVKYIAVDYLKKKLIYETIRDYLPGWYILKNSGEYSLISFSKSFTDKENYKAELANMKAKVEHIDKSLFSGSVGVYLARDMFSYFLVAYIAIGTIKQENVIKLIESVCKKPIAEINESIRLKNEQEQAKRDEENRKWQAKRDEQKRQAEIYISKMTPELIAAGYIKNERLKIFDGLTGLIFNDNGKLIFRKYIKPKGKRLIHKAEQVINDISEIESVKFSEYDYRKIHSEYVSNFWTIQAKQPAKQFDIKPGIKINEKLNGIEIRFPSKPDISILEKLKSAGWRWSSFNLCWYNRNTPDNLKFANLITQI